MIGEIVIGALLDRRLSRVDLAVYAVALRDLTFFDYLPFKQLAVARTLGVSVRSVQRSLAVLLQQGYLRAGPPCKGGEARTFGLVHDRRALLEDRRAKEGATPMSGSQGPERSFRSA